MEIVLVVTGLVAGVVLAWLFIRSKTDDSIAPMLATEKERSRISVEQLVETKRELELERLKHQEVIGKLSVAETECKNLKQRLTEQVTELESIREKFTHEFRNLANEILEEKTRKFTEQNRTSLTEILKPLGEKILEFEKRVEDTNKDSISRNSALREQLENLQRLNVQMTREAENLTRALRGDSKTQGAWGEFILESILEKSGLEKDREFFVQESFSTAEGRLRPDVIIRLPDNKVIVVDSKVSLTAYSQFVNAETDEAKNVFLKAHVQSIRNHMKGLAEKGYQRNISLPDESSLDFVIMFIPIEPAYMLALQSERNLYDEALEKRIVFVSPTLLIPSLQLIKNVWKQEYQNRNVIEIATKAGDLYDKFAGFTEDLIQLGKNLDTSKRHYEESMKKLTTGNGNLVRRVEDLKRLGAKASKTIDLNLIKRSEDQTGLFE